MIQEAFCSFEVSKLLKEKGFNEKCRGCYHSGFDDNDNPVVMLEEWIPQPYNNDFVDESFLCSAPSHQMAMAWLRKEHHKIIIIRYGKVGYAGEPPSKWHLQWWWELLKERGGFCESNMNTGNSSPEEAVEAALKHTLENLS